MKNIKKYSPPVPHLLQAQQALNLLYAKVAGRPGTGLKNLAKWFYHKVMHPKEADRMANSVDPVQTTPASSPSVCCLGLHCLAKLVCPNI